MTSSQHNLSDLPTANSLPMASVVVVNFNLGCFLEEAVESVMRQTYPLVECIVVDDASTDGSRSVIEKLRQRYPNLKVKLREENGGQTAATLDGLGATQGQFVHFLDADDAILETFLEAHVAAHLSARFPVGFTCCDMFQSFAGQIVACGDANISRYLTRRHRKVAPCRPLPAAFSDALGSRPLPKLYLVEPWHPGWPWSATSAIVYRRSALAFFADAKNLSAIRASTDTFFVLGINAIAGSILLDAPLAVYRNHGGNHHLETAPLNHVLSFDRDQRMFKTILTIDVLIDHVISNARRFDRVFWHRQIYFHLLKRLCAQHPRGLSPRKLIWRHRHTLHPLFGWRLLIAWMLGQGLGFPHDRHD